MDGHQELSLLLQADRLLVVLNILSSKFVLFTMYNCNVTVHFKWTFSEGSLGRTF